MVRPSYWPENGRPEYSNMFDWIERGQLAMSWWPDPPVIERYQLEGIRVIINASEFDNRENIRKRFFYYHFPFLLDKILFLKKLLKLIHYVQALTN